MNTIVQIVFEYPNANFYVMGDFNSETLLAGICLVMNLCKYVMNIHCLLPIKNYYLIALSHASVMLMAQRPG